MYKACSRCGKIHEAGYKCNANTPRFDYERYKDVTERKARNTTAWANKSREIRERAQQLCEVCRDRGAYTYDNLEVHHITPLKRNIDGLLDDDNLICLCVTHHKQADRGLIEEAYLRELAAKRERKG